MPVGYIQYAILVSCSEVDEAPCAGAIAGNLEKDGPGKGSTNPISPTLYKALLHSKRLKSSQSCLVGIMIPILSMRKLVRGG